MLAQELVRWLQLLPRLEFENQKEPQSRKQVSESQLRRHQNHLHPDLVHMGSWHLIARQGSLSQLRRRR